MWIIVSTMTYHAAKLCSRLWMHNAVSSLAVDIKAADCRYPIKFDLCGTMTDDQLCLIADLLICYAWRGQVCPCVRRDVCHIVCKFLQIIDFIINISVPYYAFVSDFFLSFLSVSLSPGRGRSTPVIAPSVFAYGKQNRTHADHNHIRQHFTK